MNRTSLGIAGLAVLGVGALYYINNYNDISNQVTIDSACAPIIEQERKYASDLILLATEGKKQIDLAIKSANEGDIKGALSYYDEYKRIDDMSNIRYSEHNKISKDPCIFENYSALSDQLDTKKSLLDIKSSMLEGLESLLSKIKSNRGKRT